MPTLETREQLGGRLQGFRKAAGLTGQQIAEVLGCSQGRISRIESGKTRISADEVRLWLDHTHAPAEVYDELTTLAERAEVEITAWRELTSGGWVAHQRAYDELEHDAERIRIYQPSLIPGLLQSPGYATYLLREVVRVKKDEVDAAVAARLRRQEVLYEPSTRLHAIVTEAVLRHRLGGVMLMAKQLQQIVAFARLPTVEFAVIPISTDMPATFGTSFVLYEFPDKGESLVIIELATREVREVEPESVDKYLRLFEAYHQAALKGQNAIDLIEQIIKELTAEEEQAGG